MKRTHDTCRECGTALTTDREQARGVCESCKRDRIEK